MKDGLIYFFLLFCSCLAHFGLYRVNIQYFHTTTPFRAVYFLKISKVLLVPHISASRISAPSSGFGFLWHLSDFLLGSWLSSHHNSLFNHILSSYDLCSISFSKGDELNLAHHLRHATKCPIKIPLAVTISIWAWIWGAGQVQPFK